MHDAGNLPCCSTFLNLLLSRHLLCRLGRRCLRSVILHVRETARKYMNSFSELSYYNYFCVFRLH